VARALRLGLPLLVLMMAFSGEAMFKPFNKDSNGSMFCFDVEP
jgi:hypothetical protein